MSTRRCDAHGLMYDAEVTAGCVLCRKESGLPPPMALSEEPGEPGVPLSSIGRALGKGVAVVIAIFLVRQAWRSWSAPAQEALESVTGASLGSGRTCNRTVVALSARSPQSSLREVQRRVGWSNEDVSDPDEDYDVARESMTLVVPTARPAGQKHALIVWISAENEGGPPADYLPVLAEHHVIWAGPNNAGNGRKPPVRVNLALDAAAYVQSHYDIDTRQVFVGGMSGGGRSASKDALLYPEVFSGGIFVVGTDYVRHIGPDASGHRWASRMPQADLSYVERAKSHRFLFLTGENDMNREEIVATAYTFRADGFTHTNVVVAPGMGHQMPPANVFQEGLRWMLEL